MKTYNRIKVLPEDIQENWMAQIKAGDSPSEDGVKGVFRLVDIRRTKPMTYEEQRIVVLVVDENGFPMVDTQVAFSYSTANTFILPQDFLWSPPPPRKGLLVSTRAGIAEQIQGSVVEKGSPGGITVYVLEPEYASDCVSGAGMLADHTGLHLTLQLQETGDVPMLERLDKLETMVEEIRFFLAV